MEVLGSAFKHGIISLVRDDDRPELVIHAMPMREKYRRLLPGGG